MSAAATTAVTGARTTPPAQLLDSSSPRAATLLLAVASLVLFPLFVWSYLPTIFELFRVWSSEPDYTHGWLVAPLAGYFLWIKRKSFPAGQASFAFGGLSLLAASVIARYIGALFYIDSIDAWSIPLWIGGVVWLLFGRSVLLWCLPSIAFLWFMMPLPWRIERLLSYPLQQVATHGGAFLLQILGQPAIAVGNTISLNEYELEVAQACVGLRMLVGVAAIGCAWVILVRRPWWQKVMMLAFVAPIAIAANLVRITGTALLYQSFGGATAQALSHDVAGWLMIPLAAVLFYGVLWWCDRLFVEIEQAGQGELVSRRGARH